MRYKLVTVSKVVTPDGKTIPYATPPTALYAESVKLNVAPAGTGTVVSDPETQQQWYCTASFATAITAIDAATATTGVASF
jgi:hypothetical protein